MTISQMFETVKLENTLIIGYYGGGNYGDELLMEILLRLFKKYQINAVSVFYLAYIPYRPFHSLFEGYRIVSRKIDLLKSILACNTLVIGGGGIWGLDFNRNVLILSLLITFSKFILRKKVYLFGIGYYSSTSSLGRIAAYLVGRSSDYILARDEETLKNFQRSSKHVYLDKDIAFYLKEIDTRPYEEDVATLERAMHLDQDQIVITLRRFSGGIGGVYEQSIRELIKHNPDKHFLVCLLETKTIHHQGLGFMTELQRAFSHVGQLEFNYNPIALYLVFKKNASKVKMISPQFHGQIISHLAGVSFFPLAYDNKNRELFKIIGKKDFVEIAEVSYDQLQAFIDD